MDDGLGLGPLEVDADAALALVNADEAAALVGRDHVREAPEVAVRWLDLDDVGPHVGQHLAAVGAGNVLTEVEDVDTRQRALHSSLQYRSGVAAL